MERKKKVYIKEVNQTKEKIWTYDEKSKVWSCRIVDIKKN